MKTGSENERPVFKITMFAHTRRGIFNPFAKD
jgi:hypothetical protein